MKDRVRFTLNDTAHTLDGYPDVTTCPVDLLARYVRDCQAAMWSDLDAGREPRSVPLQFDVKYDDDLTITYKVQNVIRNNYSYDCMGMLIVG